MYREQIALLSVWKDHYTICFLEPRSKIKFSCQNPDTDIDAHKSEMTGLSCIDIKNWQWHSIKLKQPQEIKNLDATKPTGMRVRCLE